MICINCFHDKTRITNSRPHKKQPTTWRRHQCPRCQTVFSTYEQPSLEGQLIISSTDGTRTPFNLGKLTISIARSFHHDKSLGDESSLDLAKTVEQQLIINCPNPSNDDIAATTHQALKRFDQMAALQYAAQHQLIVTQRRPGRPATFLRPFGD